MICIYSDNHKKHRSPFEVFNGDHDTAQEVPERVDTIKSALKKSKVECRSNTKTVSRKLLEKVHLKKYLNFLEDTSRSLGKGEYQYPSVYPYTNIHSNSYPYGLSAIARRGLYCFDTYTPILRHTYEAAISSASLAFEAAVSIKDNPKENFYALCRPPGHHAEPAMSGGYCYINNAAVAAEYLSELGRVTVLDIDFHHGNGTQQIFYERPDVLTVSIHADPKYKFPFFTGFKEERGSGKGLGKNINFPLELGINNKNYSAVLNEALNKIAIFKTDFLVVAFGADTHEKDPIGGMKLTTDYYRQMAASIKSLSVPTIIIQEGGYNTSELGNVVTSFLNGFSKNEK